MGGEKGELMTLQPSEEAIEFVVYPTLIMAEYEELGGGCVLSGAKDINSKDFFEVVLSYN